MGGSVCTDASSQWRHLAAHPGPGSLAAAGLRQTPLHQRPLSVLDRISFIPTENPTGTYRRKFRILSRWSEPSQIRPRSEPVDSTFHLSVNGLWIGYREGSSNADYARRYTVRCPPASGCYGMQDRDLLSRTMAYRSSSNRQRLFWSTASASNQKYRVRTRRSGLPKSRTSTRLEIGPRVSGRPAARSITGPDFDRLNYIGSVTSRLAVLPPPLRTAIHADRTVEVSHHVPPSSLQGGELCVCIRACNTQSMRDRGAGVLDGMIKSLFPVPCLACVTRGARRRFGFVKLATSFNG